MRASHELEEHVGEVALSVRADTLGELFAEGGCALAELMTDEGTRGRAPTELAVHLEVRSPDRTALFVDWLNELIFLTETKRAVFTAFEVRGAGDREVIAEARGIVEPALKTVLKAATLHNASVTLEAVGYRARVVLDV